MTAASPRAPEGRSYGRDFLASVVVFLVALPLCLGIAIASGAPPALGLITGIVGGLVVGTIGGAPLQVSGPAAGLTVIVWDLIQSHGLPALGVIVLLGGLIQIAAGVLRLGRYFQAVPPSLVYGMLAGIGVLIFSSQFHVMVDDTPKGGGLENLLSIPEAVWKGAFSGDSTHQLAALTGVITIVVLLAWNRFVPRVLRPIPGALVGVVAATVLASALGFPIQRVSLPDSLVGAANWLKPPSLALLREPAVLMAAFALSIIASAETLLCAVAIDRMHDGKRTDFNRELTAQGIGNAICGVFGALPMTGVIVRSSANVGAGARTRLSAILHGAWLLVLVSALPFVLRLIPVASLAAVLVFTGYKLVNVGILKQLRRYGVGEVVVYGATLTAIVATDLLTGVLLGLVLAVLKLLVVFNKLSVQVEHDTQEDAVAVDIGGTVSFLKLPDLVSALAEVPRARRLALRVDNVRYIDHASLQALADWERQHRMRGAQVVIPWELLERNARPAAAETKAPAPARQVAE